MYRIDNLCRLTQTRTTVSEFDSSGKYNRSGSWVACVWREAE